MVFLASPRMGTTFATLLAALVLLCAAQPASAAPGVGAVVDVTWGMSRVSIDREIAMLQDAGVRSVRANVSWSAAERDGKGSYNTGYLAEVDYAVSRLRAAGIEVLMPIDDGAPYWASADPARTAVGPVRTYDRHYRPRDFADYGDFARYAVARYSPMGVRHYEVWNEPNLTRFWPSGPNAAEYVEMLRAGAAGIRAADPGATVVLGGLSKSDADFLSAIYAAGGRPHFDVAAVHPYTGAHSPDFCWRAPDGRWAKDSFCALEEVHRVMQSNGDANKALWLTEFGWSSGTGQYGVGEERQAAYLRAASAKLASYPWVTRAHWYGFRNVGWLADNPIDFEASMGLVRTDFTPKPAYDALREVNANVASPAPAATPVVSLPAAKKKKANVKKPTAKRTAGKKPAVRRAARVVKPA